MSPRTAKRWGRWFLFAWVAMWLSAALLPCCEVEAAIASQQQVAHSDCGHSDGSAPDNDGSPQHTVCLSMSAPAPAPADSTTNIGAGSAQLLALVAAPVHALPSFALPPLPVAYRAAPPPVAVYLRSLRLLI